MSPSRALVVLALVVLTACPDEDAVPARNSANESMPDETRVVLLASSENERSQAVFMGAVLAAEEVATQKILRNGLRVQRMGAPDATVLAGLTDDPKVLGVVTVRAAKAIAAAEEILATTSFLVFETGDDLYERSLLGASVFQISPPHSWQAFRLARYFGPGDRGYRKIGLAREPGPQGDALSQSIARALALRSLQFADAPGDAASSIGQLRSGKPEAVLVEGSPSFVKAVVETLSADPSTSYSGRSRISQGWRPQIAGFESLLQLRPTAGSVAAGDYARADLAGGRLERVEDFRRRFKKRFGKDPTGDEIYGYEAVRALAEAAKRSGSPRTFDKAFRIKLIEELEKFDRVRFSHLPISLGPDDHVFAERDVLGLYCFENGRWLHLMRTFTSDLERTNLLEEDWASYFDGAVPGGEAPFYQQARGGVVTDRTDDLR